MHSRFLVADIPPRGEKLALVGDELHHASRVLRVRKGERVEVFDGRGSGADGRVVESTRDTVEIEIGDSIESRESPVRLVLAAALIAPDKFELVLQKGCELGVSRFIPIVSSRVETRVERVRGKRDRWERILLEATKQCGRTLVPSLDEPRELFDVLESEQRLIVFDADADDDPWPVRPMESLTLVVGPEGGLTTDEIDHARDHGARICSLGPRRLRAETAAVAAVTIAGVRLGDLLRHP